MDFYRNPAHVVLEKLDADAGKGLRSRAGCLHFHVL